MIGFPLLVPCLLRFTNGASLFISFVALDVDVDVLVLVLVLAAPGPAGRPTPDTDAGSRSPGETKSSNVF